MSPSSTTTLPRFFWPLLILLSLLLLSTLYLAHPASPAFSAFSSSSSSSSSSPLSTTSSFSAAVDTITQWGTGWMSPEERIVRVSPPSKGCLRDGVDGPGRSFRDNLRPDAHYTASYMFAGWSNQEMIQFNLLHLTLLLRRDPRNPAYIPILFPFTPHSTHLRNSDARYLPFSEVFDLERLVGKTGMGVVEMGELKEFKPRNAGGGWWEEEDREGRARVRDRMACWGTWMTTRQVPAKRADSEWLSDIFGISVSYTPISPSVLSPFPRSRSGFEQPALFPSLANFLSPPRREHNALLRDWTEWPYTAAQEMLDSWGTGARVEESWGEGYNGRLESMGGEEGGWGMEWRLPEGRDEGDVMCFDNLYWTSEKGDFPWHREDEDGPWMSVARHAHWAPALEQKSWNTVREILGLGAGKNGKGVPSLITVHIRRTDFLKSCAPEHMPCLAVPHYAHHVEETRARLVELGVKGKIEVLVTTDETDEEYLAEVRERGWHIVDHELLKTAEVYGPWYPTLIDSVILSLGAGVVGTEDSTMSLLAMRRAKAWNKIHVGAITGRFEAPTKTPTPPSEVRRAVRV